MSTRHIWIAVLALVLVVAGWAEESAHASGSLEDALWHLGVRHIDIPITPPKVWKLLRDAGVSD